MIFPEQMYFRESTLAAPFIRAESRKEGDIYRRQMITIENSDLYIPSIIRVGITDFNGEFYFRSVDSTIRYRVILRNLDEEFNSVIYERVIPHIPI